MPIAALTMAESLPLVHLVFTHTRLNALDLRATAETLIFFSLGLAAWGAQNLLARGFYATRDTLTPAIVGTALTFLNLPVYWWLSHRMHYTGLALASSIGISAYSLVLFVMLVRRTKNHAVGDLVQFFLKVCAVSVVMAAICYPVMRAMGRWESWHTIDGAFMSHAYGWAFSNPVRKVYYNLTVTGLSVLVALTVGGAELLQAAAHAVSLGRAGALDPSRLGYLVVALFVLAWLVSVAVWRLGRIEERWATAAGGGRVPAGPAGR